MALAFGGYTVQVTLRELWLPLARRRQRARREPGPGARRGGPRARPAPLRLVRRARGRRRRDRRDRGQQHHGREPRGAAAGRRDDRGRRATRSRSSGIDQVSEPHREAVVARVAVSRDGRDLGVLSPRMNQYERQREPIGTPAVRSSLFEDLYLSVMNIDPAQRHARPARDGQPDGGLDLGRHRRSWRSAAWSSLVPSRPDPRRERRDGAARARSTRACCWLGLAVVAAARRRCCS